MTKWKTLLTWLNTYRLLPIILAFVCGALLGTAQSFAGKSKDESVTATEDAESLFPQTRLDG